MSRYSPTVVPDYYGPQHAGLIIGDAFETYYQNKRQGRLDDQLIADRQADNARADEYLTLARGRADQERLKGDVDLYNEGYREGSPPENPAADALENIRGNSTQSQVTGTAPTGPQRGNLTQGQDPATAQAAAAVAAEGSKFYRIGNGYIDPSGTREAREERRLTSAEDRQGARLDAQERIAAERNAANERIAAGHDAAREQAANDREAAAATRADAVQARADAAAHRAEVAGARGDVRTATGQYRSMLGQQPRPRQYLDPQGIDVDSAAYNAAVGNWRADSTATADELLRTRDVLAGLTGPSRPQMDLRPGDGGAGRAQGDLRPEDASRASELRPNSISPRRAALEAEITDQARQAILAGKEPEAVNARLRALIRDVRTGRYDGAE